MTYLVTQKDRPRDAPASKNSMKTEDLKIYSEETLERQ